MSTLQTITQLSIGRFSYTFPALTSRRNRFAFGVKCALYPERKEEGRRLVSIALTSTILFHHWFFTTAHATAASVFDKYLKRKKLDPLEAYVPSVILTELQIKDLGNFLEVDQPKYADCRNLLRSGPAASLRVNIRAVAQYASDGGNGKNAFGNVDQCLRALEELDSLLLHASRNQPDASIKSMKSKIDNALTALDRFVSLIFHFSLLETVPPDVLYKGRAIAESYRTPEDVESENTDSELKQLESIL